MHDERESMGLDWDEGLFVVGNAVTGAWKSPMALFSGRSGGRS